MSNSNKMTIFLRLFIILSILTLINGIRNIKHREEEEKEIEEKKDEELKFKEKFIKGLLSVSLNIKESIIIKDRKISPFIISENDERLSLREEKEEEEVRKAIGKDQRMLQELEKEKEYLVINRTVELLEDKKNLKGIIDRSSAAVVLFGREIPMEMVKRMLKIEVKDNREDSSVRQERIAELPNRKNSEGLNILGDDNSNNEILRNEYRRYDYEEFEEPANGLAVSNGGNLLPKENRNAVYLPSSDDTGISDEGLASVLERIFFEKILEISKKNEESYKENPDELIKELDFDNNHFSNDDDDDDSEDICQKWLQSENRLKETFLGDLRLPSCPCRYPSRIFYDDQIWDEFDTRYFRWRDVSGDTERLDVYKPGATYCIRSLLNQGGGTAAAQHCCYDIKRRLITRGSGAGTPNFISPEVSPVLHERIDVLPWRLCKGDFSRLNKAREPNNENRCKENPNDYEYTRQIESTKHY